ncbi:NAD(P)/FAD-dependent oxidoreductase [Longirhabdus pacifica]|uniref:NAD(P)/FAD-dependent oxidoreductase n=1 Tax=Longirhabdus pacifica TaxID=2305227 RepID=UPI001008821B|nr:NAD(P)/FAD-dependent oxidoreductase [Longirhabdus pacifica]
MYDFIIVGARCAGAVTAYFLAKQGYRIFIIDQYKQPGPTLSSHIIGETDIYDSLDITKKFKESAIPEMTRMRVDVETRVFESNITVTPRALSVRRELLDSWLFQKLEHTENIDIVLQAKVLTTLQKDEHITGVKYKTIAGEEKEVEAKLVIGADGRNSIVAKSVKAEMYHASKANHLAVYYAYVDGMYALPIPTMEWYWSGEDILLCNPLDQDMHCIAVMIPQQTFEHWSHDVTHHFLQRIQQIETLRSRTKNIQMKNNIRGIASTASYIRQAYGQGWVLVGDAAAYLHPISGSGIDNAVCMAKILAQCLDKWLKHELCWESAMSLYVAKRDERIKPQYDACLQTLAKAATSIPQDQLQMTDLLCTFPSLAKEMSVHAQDIYTMLMEG